MDGGEEGFAVFGVSCGDAAPSLEMQESVLDEVAQLIEIFVVRPFLFSVFLRRDDSTHALSGGLTQDCVRIVGFIGNQVIGAQPFDQAASLRAIRCGTLCNKDSDRHTMRIHGQMYLGVEPPFVRLMS